MPRPSKRRRICEVPKVLQFGPIGFTDQPSDPIKMHLDEYECIRLLDVEGYTQQQCAEAMQVARTTVQKIYADARKKLGEALVYGHQLQLEGGDVVTHHHEGKFCGKGCYRRGRKQREENT